ncbi:MAG: enoyl-CoA hydratase/isomerase family protein [SAR324 cluster bacterium]|nr:enoyl-CoA hydratase/isomerase family protein [SAR324 cluster bacterium]
MTFQSIIVEVEEEVATLTLNRPDKLNALNPSLLQETAAAIREMNDDDKIKSLIITGNGRAFCSGADLSEPVSAADVNQKGINRRERLSPFVSYGWMIRQIDEFSKPVIAAVNGIAVGGGLALALACDIRIASENARFASIFVRRGLVADCGTTFYLPRLVGAAKALELMWTGDFVDATEAERIGLVNRVVPAENLLKTTGEFALRMARGPSISIELHKRLTYEGLRAESVQTQMANEDYARYVCRQTDDVKEGINSFLEKREPIFKGR